MNKWEIEFNKLKDDKVKLRIHKNETLHRLVEDIEGFLKNGDKNILEWDWDVCMYGLTPKFRIDYLNIDDTISPKDLPRLTITLEENDE